MSSNASLVNDPLIINKKFTKRRTHMRYSYPCNLSWKKDPNRQLDKLRERKSSLLSLDLEQDKGKHKAQLSTFLKSISQINSNQRPESQSQAYEWLHTMSLNKSFQMQQKIFGRFCKTYFQHDCGLCLIATRANRRFLLSQLFRVYEWLNEIKRYELYIKCGILKERFSLQTLRQFSMLSSPGGEDKELEGTAELWSLLFILSLNRLSIIPVAILVEERRFEVASTHGTRAGPIESLREVSRSRGCPGQTTKSRNSLGPEPFCCPFLEPESQPGTLIDETSTVGWSNGNICVGSSVISQISYVGIKQIRGTSKLLPCQTCQRVLLCSVAKP